MYLRSGWWGNYNHAGISSMDQIRLLVYLLYAIAGSTSNIFDIECKYGGMKVKLCRLRLFLQQRATPCNIFVSDENSKLVLFFGGDQSLTMPSNFNFLFGLHFFIPLVLSSVFPLRVGFSFMRTGPFLHKWWCIFPVLHTLLLLV